jgi:hypothetical protein
MTDAFGGAMKEFRGRRIIEVRFTVDLDLHPGARLAAQRWQGDSPPGIDPRLSG